MLESASRGLPSQNRTNTNHGYHCTHHVCSVAPAASQQRLPAAAAAAAGQAKQATTGLSNGGPPTLCIAVRAQCVRGEKGIPSRQKVAMCVRPSGGDRESVGARTRTHVTGTRPTSDTRPESAARAMVVVGREGAMFGVWARKFRARHLCVCSWLWNGINSCWERRAQLAWASQSLRCIALERTELGARENIPAEDDLYRERDDSWAGL